MAGLMQQQVAEITLIKSRVGRVGNSETPIGWEQILQGAARDPKGANERQYLFVRAARNSKTLFSKAVRRQKNTREQELVNLGNLVPPEM
jgi:hypothetical protein